MVSFVAVLLMSFDGNKGGNREILMLLSSFFVLVRQQFCFQAQDSRLVDG
jgi:hypothetical protein